MAYDVTMTQLDATEVGGWLTGLIAAASMGFPSGNFATLLYSQWMCSPGTISPAAIAPDFVASGAGIFKIEPSRGLLTLGNVSGQFFSGSFAGFAGSLRTHLLLSVNTQTRAIQLYFNDHPVTVTGSWTGSPGSNWFNVGTGSAIFSWNGENAAIISPPAVADIWCGTSVSDAFVDLTVVANRRKFIDSQLRPVYLGTNGSAPLGYQPQVYCTVQSGGAASDLLTNHGTGASLTMHHGNTLSLQASGICALAETSSLAMDNVLAFAAVKTSNLVFLSWSDDRGHSWSNPVSQPIGDRGEYLTSASWNRLGYARDRCFKIEWSVPVATALQGAFISLDSSAKT